MYFRYYQAAGVLTAVGGGQSDHRIGGVVIADFGVDGVDGRGRPN